MIGKFRSVPPTSSKKSFKAYNEQLAEQNIPPLANPRNAASGSLRMKDPNEVGRRKLEAFLYNVSYYTRNNQPIAAEDEALLNTHAGIFANALAGWFQKPCQ